jgi:hypothetical protein
MGDGAMMRQSALILLVTMVVAAHVLATNGEAITPPEGTAAIPWVDDLDFALAQSKASGRPILALFHDAPDCTDCQSIWNELSSHPLLAEAAAEAFVVLRLNLRQSQRFTTARAPLMFLNAAGQPLLPPPSRPYAPHRLALRMQHALHAAHRPVPRDLQALAMEQDVAKHKRAAFAILCYWIGEYALGKIEGMISTEAGCLEGHEVTLVTYHQDHLTLPQLAHKAAEVKCARKVFAPTQPERQGLMSSTRLAVGTLDDRYRKAKPSEQKKQLQRWNLSGISG